MLGQEKVTCSGKITNVIFNPIVISWELFYLLYYYSQTIKLYFDVE